MTADTGLVLSELPYSTKDLPEAVAFDISSRRGVSAWSLYKRRHFYRT